MKSRLAIMAMLVAGLLMSGTGAGLAVTGVSGSGDASVAQYGEELPCDRNNDGIVDGNEDLNGDAPGCDEIFTLPRVDESDCDTNDDGVISPSEAAANGCGGVKNEVDEETDEIPGGTPTPREQAAQPTRQTEAGGGDELPFTGFAAVPILIGGIALLAGGLVLRRRTAAE